MAESQEKIVTLINQLVKELPGYTPLDIPLDKNEAEQNVGLAQAFAIKGFRDYMLKQIRKQATLTLDVENMDGLLVLKGRLLTIKEFYRATETCFNEYQKLEKAFKNGKN